MGQAEHCSEDPVGILRECRAHPFVDSNHRLSDYSQNQGGLQKSIFHHRGGHADKDISLGEDFTQRNHHQAMRICQSQSICQRTHSF